MIFNLRTIKMARGTNIHGESKTRFYRIYNGIKQRCENPKSPAYKYYGVFGLKCEWNTYEDFKKDMYKSYLKHCEKYGEEETTIDRIDNSLGYSKENCRRATHKEQVHNRITTKMYEWKGKKLSVSEIYNKEKPNVLYDTFRQRLKKGWSVERSLKPMW